MHLICLSVINGKYYGKNDPVFFANMNEKNFINQIIHFNGLYTFYNQSQPLMPLMYAAH